MRQTQLNQALDIISMVETARAELQRVTLDPTLSEWVKQQRSYELSNLINNVLKTEALDLLRDVVNNVENRKAA